VRRILVLIALTTAVVLATSGAALACGSLVAANGAVDLEKTTTLAAYHDGLEHYITTFEFAGEEGEPLESSFGSIIPLPGRPTKVERGGDWTLQRLQQEVAPPLRLEETAAPTTAASGDKVEVLEEVRIDSLDVTILRGGGRGVARWANENGFDLTLDTPEVLEFYSERSPYFMAAKFDATSAAEQGLGGGDGIPVHLTIPVDAPWVPLRILATAMDADEQIDADVFLLTDERPSLLSGDGFRVERSEQASSSLLTDLRSDKGMEWIPDEMWLTFGQVDTVAEDLSYDLAIGVDGDDPSYLDTGFEGSVFTWPLGTR